MPSVQQNRPRGWWYPWIFVGGFGLVFVVNAILLTLATVTFNGFETREPSNRRNGYNDKIAASAEQARLGWNGSLSLRPLSAGSADGGRTARVTMTFTGAEGHPLDGLDVAVLVWRPTQEGLDRHVELPPTGPGTYARDITFPLPGLWELRVSAGRGDSVQWRTIERIDLR